MSFGTSNIQKKVPPRGLKNKPYLFCGRIYKHVVLPAHMSITSLVLADISRAFTPTILASMMRLLSKIPQQFGRTILMLQYLCSIRVSPQAAVFLEWDSFGFNSRDPTIPLHSNLFGISHTQKRASHSRNSGY